MLPPVLPPVPPAAPPVPDPPWPPVPIAAQSAGAAPVASVIITIVEVAPGCAVAVTASGSSGVETTRFSFASNPQTTTSTGPETLFETWTPSFSEAVSIQSAVAVPSFVWSPGDAITTRT